MSKGIGGKAIDAFKSGATLELPTSRGAFSDDINKLKQLGEALVALFSALVVVAIIAVLVSPRSNTPGVIASFFSLIRWAIGLVVQPVTPSSGYNVPLTSSGTGQSITGSTGSDTPGSGTLPSTAPTGADWLWNPFSSLTSPSGSDFTAYDPSTFPVPPIPPTVATPGAIGPTTGGLPPGQIPTMVIRPGSAAQE